MNLSSKQISYLLVFPLSLLGFILFVAIQTRLFSVGIHRTSIDFSAYLAGSLAVRTGNGRSLYQLSYTQKIQEEISKPYPRSKAPYRALPQTTFFYIPLSYLPYPVAHICYLIISVTLIFSSSYLLLRVFFRRFPVILYWIIIGGFFPLLFGIYQGQPTVFGYTLLISSLIYFEKKRYFLSGCLLSLLIYKPHILLPLALIILLSRKRQFILGLGLGLIIHICIATAITGIPALLAYPGFLAATENIRFGTSPMGSTGIIDHISYLRSSRLDLYFISILMVTVAFIFTLIIGYLKCFQFPPLRLFSVAILIGLPFSVHVGHHDLLFLIIPILYTLSHELTSKYNRNQLYLAVGLILFTISMPITKGPLILLRALILYLSGLWLIATADSPAERAGFAMH